MSGIRAHNLTFGQTAILAHSNARPSLDVGALLHRSKCACPRQVMLSFHRADATMGVSNRLLPNPSDARSILLAQLANPAVFLGLLLALVIGISVHEFSHAWMANRLGDPTARSQGRLTLNPLAHLDLLGTLMIFLIGFGWGKRGALQSGQSAQWTDFGGRNGSRRWPRRQSHRRGCYWVSCSKLDLLARYDCWHHFCGNRNYPPNRGAD